MKEFVEFIKNASLIAGIFVSIDCVVSAVFFTIDSGRAITFCCLESVEFAD